MKPIDLHAVIVRDLERDGDSYIPAEKYARENLARQIAEHIVKDERYFTVQYEDLPGFPGHPRMQIIRCDCRVLCDIDFARLVKQIREEVWHQRPVMFPMEWDKQ